MAGWDTRSRGQLVPGTAPDRGTRVPVRDLVDQVSRRPLPFLDEGMLRPSAPPQRQVKAPARPVQIPEQVLRIFVGDLAPQVSGALNLVQTNELVGTGAALGSVALGALLIPVLIK
jgi:hypothetical protein